MTSDVVTSWWLVHTCIPRGNATREEAFLIEEIHYVHMYIYTHVLDARIYESTVHSQTSRIPLESYFLEYNIREIHFRDTRQSGGLFWKARIAFIYARAKNCSRENRDKSRARENNIAPKFSRYISHLSNLANSLLIRKFIRLGMSRVYPYLHLETAIRYHNCPLTTTILPFPRQP